MGEYKAELIIYDERNGETVATLRNIEIEDWAFTDDAIESIEEFPSVSISKYEDEDYA